MSLNYLQHPFAFWLLLMEGSRTKIWLLVAVACFITQATASEELLTRRHLNLQEFMNISEIIHYWGYPSEEHEILTEDGYYLKVDRIPDGRHSPVKTGPKPVVLLLCGLVIEGREFIASLPNNSLGFFLADAGYDVWVLNNRGTTWSRKHQNLTVDQEEFWNFTFHEMAIYDVPATINFILQKTQQEGLYVIGHSQGASLAKYFLSIPDLLPVLSKVFSVPNSGYLMGYLGRVYPARMTNIEGLIASSILPHLAKKIKLLMCLAPSYTLVGIKGPVSIVLNLPERLIRLIWGNKEFCVLSNRLKLLNAKVCSHPILDKLCLQVFFICAGYNVKNLNASRADVYFGIYPDYSSVKTLIHWGQVARSNEFKYFDYGVKNREIYNTSSPPFYKIEDMTVPTAVWSGGNDFIEPPKDVELLLPQISNLVFYKNIPSWQHLDFIWGLDAPEFLYSDMLDLMQKFK